MNNQRNNDSMKLEEKIMSGIKSGQIKLRSKYIFLSKKLGLSGALSLSVILAIFFFNLILFYMKTTDNFIYLTFGKNGFLAFLESFPYLLVIVFLLFLLFTGYLITKTDWSYKKPFKYIMLMLIMIVLLVGGVLASTSFSQRIEKQAFANRGTGLFLKPFLKRGMGLRDSGLVGEIDEIDENYLIINTPRGKQYLDLSHLLSQQISLEFEKREWIIAIGERKDNIFLTKEIRLIKNKECPMIRRGIYIYPKEKPMNHFFQPNEKVKKCLHDCIEVNGFNQFCFEKCRPMK